MRALNVEPRRLSGAVLGALLFLGSAAAVADETSWRIDVIPVYVQIDGLGQHVLTRRSGGSERVELDTDSALGYRAAVLHDRGRWSYGLDFFIHRTDQGLGPFRETAAGTGDELVYELPGRSFVSTGPDETLYYETLEDTTVELWILDLYARRELGSGGPWKLLFGLRNADFDNDYRAIAGVDEIGGTRIDASSNYSRMIGPVVGFVGEFERGRHAFQVDLRQSVVFGDIELKRTLRDFEGPPGPYAVPPEEVPPLPVSNLLTTTDSIEVPMTDLSLAWRVLLGEHWTLGARFDATAWWNLAVPPGVVPGRAGEREEATAVTTGFGATLGFRF